MAKIDYTDELQFEQAVVDNLMQNCGWKGGVFAYPTEDDLIENWKNILYENNNHIDILNGQPLTDGEMSQIISKVNACVSPLDINEFVNGKTVSITRDNPADTLHFGKEVSLKIYDRREIANGQSRYQIARQPKFAHKSAMLPNRRGDLLLLINGMPLIHIELKSSKVDVSQAANQIKKYSHEGIFSQGIMKLVQIFVAMTPNETLYFANPGTDDRFNPDFYFHWGDFNNEPVNEWKKVLQDFLSIPMAHQMIGFYMVADKSDGVLKVLRSYQYYAAMGISTNIRNKHWGERNPYGGYVWHTTGSGKTMTSFKAAQLASDSGDADKVVFLLDRIELGTQTLENYRDFKPVGMDVQDTSSGDVLVAKLKSNSSSDTLIVTSIQKMSEIDPTSKAHDIEIINNKRMVIICDECHRNTFGEMMIKIRRMFPFAIFFGFTGTPILPENERKGATSADIFGSEIHRYSIADGIRDGNVLGFDTTKVLTFKDDEIRQEVALRKADAQTVTEAISNEDKRKIFLEWMKNISMVEVEKEVPKSQYTCEKHKNSVVDDILNKWTVRSVGGKFHAIMATCSIPDAIEYYRIFKSRKHDLKITVLFDPSIDNDGDFAITKEDALVEILTDYNDMYGKNYTIPTAAAFKKDLSARLAHKKPYYKPKADEKLDVLIVVNQMLTGFDSKWINTLYLDKNLQYQEVIQAFSRTNRLYNSLEKPFGQIYFYHYPHTQEVYNAKAIALYSGDRAFGMLVQKLPLNIKAMNKHYEIIKEVFATEGIDDFSVLPSDNTLKGKFAKEFRSLTNYLASAKIQGFVWSKLSYYFEYDDQTTETVVCEIDERTYNILLQRYKELVSGTGGGGGQETPPFPIDTHITEINTDKIDADYMNTKFQKFLIVLNSGTATEEERKAVRLELHNSFASLSQEDQRFAEIFINDLLSGKANIESGKTFKDYIVEYRTKAQHDILHKVAEVFGLDEQLLRDMRNLHLTDANINEYSRFDNLMATVDWNKAAAYIGKPGMFVVKRDTDKVLRKYIITGEIKLK